MIRGNVVRGDPGARDGVGVGGDVPRPPQNPRPNRSHTGPQFNYASPSDAVNKMG